MSYRPSDDPLRELPDTGDLKEAAALLGSHLLASLDLAEGDFDAGLMLAANAMRNGHLAEALRLYATMAICQPMNYEIQLGLANCAVEAQQHYVAMQAAAVLIALYPQDPRGYIISGKACLHAGLHVEAREDFRQTIAVAEASGAGDLSAEALRLLELTGDGRA